MMFGKRIGIILILFLTLFSCMNIKKQSKINRIENGIIPAVKVKGQNSIVFSMDQLMEKLVVPGVSLAIIENGRIEWLRSYGVTEQGGDPVDKRTVFQAGSVSKTVTAMAALNLVEEGKIELDRNVNDYLTTWKVPENKFTKIEKVTLRRLLSHTAGISSFNQDTGVPVNGKVPSLLQLLKGEGAVLPAPVTVDRIPGSQYRYSNEGYAVVQMVMLDIEGKPFSAIMRERVLEPLGMTHSSFSQRYPDNEQEVIACGHIGDGERVEGKGWVYSNLAAAGLWTTPADLAKLIIDIQKSLKGEGNKILSRNMVQEMLTPQIGKYGLGLRLSGEGVARNFSHNGHNRGFLCAIRGFIEQESGIVIMANSNKSTPILRGMTYAVADEYGWPGLAPKLLEPFELQDQCMEAYVGRYVIGDYSVDIGIDPQSGLLSIKHFEGEDLLIPESETVFYQQLDGIRLTFSKDKAGNVSEIQLMGGRLVLTKTE